jgi:Leucine-rich repeat (LRR) protein
MYAIEARYVTQKALAKADSLNRQNQGLIKTIFFYEDSLAVAYDNKSRKYGFVNKDGKVLIDYQYPKAGQFEEPGFAKVIGYDGFYNKDDYLIDTKGKKYKVAYSLKNIPNDITALDLRNQGLQTLPDSLSRYHLEVLLLSQNQLTELPDFVYQYKNLKTLDLNSNQIDTIFNKIGQLTNLTTLDLHGNSLSSLPAEIGQLTNLTELTLGFNYLSSLPAEIGQLTNLTTLVLYQNSLSSLPAEIGQLTNLTTLVLYQNSLSSLPAEIGQLTKLTKLDLSSNSLSSLPAEIGQLTNLTSLDLRSNKFEDTEKERIKGLLPDCYIEF